MQWKKILATALSAAMLTACFTGCGGGSGCNILFLILINVS